VALYELTADGVLHDLPSTTFATEHVLERADLQAALREHIKVLGEDLLVVSEEFGGFEVRRRIDLLCVDNTARLVVVELKRTEDGGHMELQALRYAAMVSAMTFDQLVDTYQRYLVDRGDPQPDRARDDLARFLDAAGGEDAVLDRRVRVVLVSAGFDPQITTTVLWLNELYGLEISCVRILPYRVGGRLLLDVTQLIPLPEATEFQVALRERETAARAAGARVQHRDMTKYVITTPSGREGPMPKRRAVLALIRAAHLAGYPAAKIAEALSTALPGPARLRPVDGHLDGATLRSAFAAAHPEVGEPGRFFLEEPLHDDDGRTWVPYKMWATDTVPALDALVALDPDRFGYEEA
jgi:hypothetical protein